MRYDSRSEYIHTTFSLLPKVYVFKNVHVPQILQFRFPVPRELRPVGGLLHGGHVRLLARHAGVQVGVQLRATGEQGDCTGFTPEMNQLSIQEGL